MKKTRIVVVGVGAVGSTTAYTLLLRNRMDELVLIDANHDKALGDALDMNHGMPFVGKTKVWAGTYADCSGADIIIITAGAAQKPGESRIDLLKRNLKITDSILNDISKYTTDAILLFAINPVDVMSYYAWKKLRSKWAGNKIIGSGTLLDSARFKYLISEKLNVDARSVHAKIIGEHGDSELPVWSLANLAGTKLPLTEEEKEEVFVNTRDAAYQIIQAKGATFYAIALALDRIVTAITEDEGAVLNVSTLLENYHGVSDVYLGVPCIVDRNGIRQVLDIQLDEQETALLQASAEKIRDILKNSETI